MSTQGLYEEWKQQVEQVGIERGRKQGGVNTRRLDLLEIYETRFGAIPVDPTRTT